MKGTGAKRNVCPGSCVSTGAKFPVAPVESAPMLTQTHRARNMRRLHSNSDMAKTKVEQVFWSHHIVSGTK